MTNLINKLTLEARAKMDAMPAEQQERLLWWLSRSEYVHETPYYAVITICMIFRIQTDDFYTLFEIL
jgi:hypothetical protein